ncbi:MAG: chromate transporter [Peptococcaceae bacterium]|nr:chromate transporter [Peptococcaceae bacterium]
MLTDLWNLFLAFFRASNLGFGGGPAIIPLIQAEAVTNYKWMTNAQFSDTIAVANALPGPIATKLASYIGYQVASWPGVIVALIATILPTVLILIFLGSLLTKYANSKGLKAALKGVRPIVTALLVSVAYDMAVSAFQIKVPMDYLTFAIGAGAAAALYFFKMHPALLIVISMIVGYFIF